MATRERHIKKHYIIIFTCILFTAGSKFAYEKMSDNKFIIDVPYISQKGSFSTGCELVSATMLLNYYGYDISVNDFVMRTPTFSVIKSQDGLVGENPAKYFIGDPRSNNGYGCYAPVIVSVMNSFLKNGNKKAENITGTSFETLVNDYIKNNNPVLVWATMNMKEPYNGNRWKIKSTGKTFQWIAGEHCLVLVGYNKDNYYFNDPYETNGVVPFKKEVVKKRYISLGRQAVSITNGS